MADPPLPPLGRAPESGNDYGSLTSISHIRLSPFKFAGYINESQAFTALGVDASGEIVHGAKFAWESSDTGKIAIDETGRATFLEPGLTRIICRAGAARAEAYVLIRPSRRLRQSDVEWKNDQDSFQVTGAGKTVAMLNLSSSLLEKLSPTVHGQGTPGTDIGQSAAVEVVGNPRYAALEQSRLGTVMPQQNFNMGFPLVDLGGRGLSLNLTLYYNSNVWGARFDSGLNKTVYTFDPIQSYPSPGFTLGFGRIAYYDLEFNSSTGYSYALMLIGPDGTRHSLGRVPQSTTATVQTTDGSHITYVGSVTGGGRFIIGMGRK